MTKKTSELPVPDKYYINPSPDERGYYGGPEVEGYSEAVVLPRQYLNYYIENFGFVIPTIENGIVTGLRRNIEAYDAFIASLPPPMHS